MALMDFFVSQKKKQPTIRGYSFGGAILNYDLSFEVYFKYYNLNPFVFACINKRSNEIGARGWELSKGGKSLFNKDFEEFIKYSTSSTPKEFIKRLIRDYDITGNAYVYIVKDEKGKKNIGLQILDPRYVKPVANQQGQILGYIQNLEGIKVFLRDELFHIKNDNDIDNEVVGKSRMTSLFIDIESDQEARDSNLAFFKNNQTPSSIIILDPEFEIDENDEKKTKEKIKEMFDGGKYVGGKNKYRSMMAQGIKEIIKVQDKINDMEFLLLRKFTLEVVSAVYEVPKSILGFTDQTNYSNGLTQYDIYMDTIEALEDKFTEFITKIFKIFDEKYEFIFLKDNLRKLNIKSTIAGSLYKDKNIITLNEARKIIQYDKVEDGEKFYEVKGIAPKEQTPTK